MREPLVSPRIRGFIATNAHPIGCARNVERQIDRARRARDGWTGGNALILGASSGYGLATRIVAAFGYGMNTLGVGFQRPAKSGRTASAGAYNTAAFSAAATADGLEAVNVRGDAFSGEVLREALTHLRARLGTVDLVIYSLAAPMRTDPVSGVTHRSVLKTIGGPATEKTINLRTEEVVPIEVPSASEREIADTIAVMGGSDLERWVTALLHTGLLARNARVIAYSYSGPTFTQPFYLRGTMGRAKADMEATCRRLDARLRPAIGGRCYASVNKSVITQAAMAIPIFPLYVSTTYAVMREHGVHEEAIDQIMRLFRDHLAPGVEPTLDAEGRIRLDDRELAAEIQTEIAARWPQLDTANLYALTDWAECRQAFRQLFGFDVPGVDYAVSVETHETVGSGLARAAGDLSYPTLARHASS